MIGLPSIHTDAVPMAISLDTQYLSCSPAWNCGQTGWSQSMILPLFGAVRLRVSSWPCTFFRPASASELANEKHSAPSHWHRWVMEIHWDQGPYRWARSIAGHRCHERHRWVCLPARVLVLSGRRAISQAEPTPFRWHRRGRWNAGATPSVARVRCVAQ
jgi:hypothetical protein